MRVLVAGGSGFIGSAICRELLERDVPVRVLSRSKERASHIWGMDGAEFSEASIHGSAEEIAAAAEGCTHLINAAGIIRETRDNSFQQVHVEGTRNLLRAAEQQKMDGFVQVSALGVREDAETRYQTSKWEGEELVRESGLDYSILRPSIVFGEGSDFIRTVVGLMYDLRWAIPAVSGFKRRIPPPFFQQDVQRWLQIGRASGKMQPVWVGDVATVAANCLERDDLSNRTLELGGDRSFTFRELQEACSKMMRIPWRYPLIIPVWAARIKAALLPHALFPVTGEQITMLMETYQCDPQVLRDALGYSSHSLTEKLRPVLKRWQAAAEIPIRDLRESGA